MVSEQFILAIDLGTSGCKAALVSASGRVHHWHFRPIQLFLFPDGGAEQDPEEWWTAFLEASRAVLEESGVSRDRVAAVCCSTQGEGTIPVDAEGRPLMNAVLWMDARGAKALKSITQGRVNLFGFHPWRLLRWIYFTGGVPSSTGKDPAAHMLFIKHERPEVYRSTFKFLNVLDYLNLRLTGRFAATYDSILTSWVTDNRDPNHIRYSPALLRNCGIDRDKFPELVSSTAILGTLKPDVARALGLSENVRVVAGAIDTTAAAVGSGAVRDYDAHLYIGTSSWLAAHVPFKKTNVLTSIASVPCALPGRYLMIALQATAGGNLTFLRDQILYHKDELLSEEHLPNVYKIMDRIAEKTPAGSRGVIYTPWIYGERCPVEDHQVRAALFNLSLENSREDIIRAVLEGVALNTRWMLRPAERFLGRRLSAINIAGGGAASDVWCQIFADVLDRPIRQVKDPIQANVRGAAFIAAYGLGLLRFEDIPEIIEYRNTYLPNAETRAIYNGRFREFVSLYRQNKAIYRRLNG